MDRQRKLRDLIERFQAIAAKYAGLEGMAMTFPGYGRPLYKSELHFLKAVREHPEANLSGLASILGVTRGAISQILARLEKKGLVARANLNRKEYAIGLTPAGETVYREHEEFHRGHFRELERAIRLLPPDKIDFIEWMFGQLDSFYDTFEKRLIADGVLSIPRARKGEKAHVRRNTSHSR